MLNRIVVHIGFHKTGTSSIQKFCGDFREELATNKIFFYTGTFGENNHVELHAAAMRESRLSPFKMSEEFRSAGVNFAKVGTDVASFVQAREGTFVFSAEGLSYLRYEDEMKRLREIFGGHDLEIVAYHRDRQEWLASYRAELKKHPAPPMGCSPDDSFANTQPDSWLLDFERRMEPFRDAFGPGRVHVIDYDEVCSKEHSVIPSFIKLIGADHIANISQCVGHYWFNGRHLSDTDVGI